MSWNRPLRKCLATNLEIFSSRHPVTTPGMPGVLLPVGYTPDHLFVQSGKYSAASSAYWRYDILFLVICFGPHCSHIDFICNTYTFETGQDLGFGGVWGAFLTTWRSHHSNDEELPPPVSETDYLKIIFSPHEN